VKELSNWSTFAKVIVTETTQANLPKEVESDLQIILRPGVA